MEKPRYSPDRYRTVAQWNTCDLADDIEDALAQLSRTRDDLGRIDLRLRAELQKRKPATLVKSATG